jgi:glucose-1-phosphate adenylyltransferase
MDKKELNIETIKDYYSNEDEANRDDRIKNILIYLCAPDEYPCIISQAHQNAIYENLSFLLEEKEPNDLIEKAQAVSSMYTLPQIVSLSCDKLDVRGYAHEGYFAAITDLKSFYDANLALLDIEKAEKLINENWPIYTRTNDSCPTQYFEDAEVKHSVVSNGCLIEGTIENSIIGRGCTIKKGVVIKNSVVLPDTRIEEGIHIENQVIDKHSRLIHCKELIATLDAPGYVRRGDTL